MKNLLIFVHGTRMFTQAELRADLEREEESGIFSYNIELEYITSLSTKDNYCEEDYDKYPDNMRAATLAKECISIK